ncbi:MAG: riboflavin synthase [Bacteroidota bacterium]
MFTGIIEEAGVIREALSEGGGIRFTIQAPVSSRELHVNDSVSVNGVCQTVVGRSEGTFTVQAVEETLRKTTLQHLGAGKRVNIELPVRLNDRLSGHLVQGHVDCVGTIAAIRELESSRLVTIDFPPAFARYVVPVGSIAVDGVSLTIAERKGSQLTVSIIPHTLAKTTLADLKTGAEVNLEFDVIGKYVESLLVTRGQGEAVSALTAEKLRQWGYDI